MEILEILYALTQACGCFLEVFAVGTNVGAGVAGVKAQKTRQLRRAAQEHGEPTPPHNGWSWLFFGLLLVGLALLGLTIWKYTR